MVELEVKILETEVETTLCYASRVKYNELGYNFPIEFIKNKIKVLIKVKDLPRKSNIKITRVCSSCGDHHLMTFHKANISPICHYCITQTNEFRNKTGIGVLKSRVKKGDRAYYRTIYKHALGDIPKNLDIHHINMDEKDDDISNLIALPHGDHLKCHGTLNRLCRILMEKNIIYFDKTDFIYKLVSS